MGDRCGGVSPGVASVGVSAGPAGVPADGVLLMGMVGAMGAVGTAAVAA